MKSQKTEIPGLLKLIPFSAEDQRGTFVKTFHRPTFESLGLSCDFREEYYSLSTTNVLRGMHFQLPPRDHVKMVTCLQGKVLDVILDLRKGSPMFGRFTSFELNAVTPELLYIPPGLAHGFYVLEAPAIMYYKTSIEYFPEHDSGILWNSFGFAWPAQHPMMSVRDQKFVRWDLFVTPFTFSEGSA